MNQSNLNKVQKNFKHTSVLLKETIEALNVTQGGRYIDATIGGGGHTREILDRGGTVLGIDQDRDAIDFLKGEFVSGSENLTLLHGNFSDIKELAKKNGFKKVEGIIFDLGLSSYQIDDSGRGFSIKKDELLDMRMDARTQVSALDIINSWNRDELYEIFTKFGEIRPARAITSAIERARRVKRIETTGELALLIEENVRKEGKIHPATKVFMALRIVVNNELTNLKKGLVESLEILEPKGVLAVISFHSLEDRIVKNVMRESGYLNSRKPILPEYEETRKNPRSRSAKLRILTKIKV